MQYTTRKVQKEDNLFARIVHYRTPRRTRRQRSTTLRRTWSRWTPVAMQPATRIAGRVSSRVEEAAHLAGRCTKERASTNSGSKKIGPRAAHGNNGQRRGRGWPHGGMPQSSGRSPGGNRMMQEDGRSRKAPDCCWRMAVRKRKVDERQPPEDSRWRKVSRGWPRKDDCGRAALEDGHGKTAAVARLLDHGCCSTGGVPPPLLCGHCCTIAVAQRLEQGH